MDFINKVRGINKDSMKSEDRGKDMAYYEAKMLPYVSKYHKALKKYKKKLKKGEFSKGGYNWKDYED